MDWLFELSNVTLKNQSKWIVTLEQQYKPSVLHLRKKSTSANLLMIWSNNINTLVQIDTYVEATILTQQCK